MCRRLKPKPPTTQPWRTLPHSPPDSNQPASENSGTVHPAIGRFQGLLRGGDLGELARPARWKLVAAMEAKGDWPAARAEIADLVKDPKTTPDERVQAANYLRLHREEAAAKTQLDWVLKADPTHARAVVTRAVMLTDAKKTSGMGSSGTSGATGTGTTGTTGTGTTGTGTTSSSSRMSGDEDEYLLRAESSSVNLSQHVNHQVEVTGRVTTSGSGSTTSGTSGTGTTGTGTTGTGTTGTGTTGTGTTGTGTTGSTASRSSSGDKPTLSVTSIKMIASECK